MDDPEEPFRLDITPDSAFPRRMLTNQAGDLITRQTEQELRKRYLETTHEYSLKLLEAEFLDRQQEREHQKSANITAGILIAFLSLLLAVGIGYALHLNKDQLVMEFLKGTLYVVTGGVGGYSLKRVRDKTEASKQ
jgi:hypothetical protein